jgi:hypothetical protein
LSFPVRRIHQKVAFWYRSGVGLMGSYEYVRGMIVWLFSCLSFPCTGLCHPGGLRLKCGIM